MASRFENSLMLIGSHERSVKVPSARMRGYGAAPSPLSQCGARNSEIRRGDFSILSAKVQRE
jgi:hypothetical protein